MTLFATYSSPATPGNAAWQEPMAGEIRLGSIAGLAGEARLGVAGVGGVVLDDPTSSIGHAADGVVGLKQWHFTETACPVGNQRLWTGYVGPRKYRRGEDQTSSLRTGTARKIDVTLVDLNDFLTFRVFPPEDLDPTSSFVRGAETDLERVQGLLNDVDFISTTLFDVGYIPSTGGVAMSAKDYEGQRPIDVLNECAQVSGRNFWVKYHEATNQFVLWYDDPNTDGSSTLTYDSALRLTNVLSEVDGTTTFAGIDPELTYDPSRLISAAYGTWDGGTAYRTEPDTAETFAWRDAVYALGEFVKDQTKANAVLDRYLEDNSTEDPTIRVSVQLPAQYVTGIHEGMRLQVHFTHLPIVYTEFTWTRVLSRNIRVDVETQEYYWLDLELSPIIDSVVGIEEIKVAKQQFSAVQITWDVAPVEGQLLVAILTMRAGAGWGTIPAGWTVIDPPTVAEDFVTIGVNGNVLTEYPAGMAYKYATAGETSSPAFTNIRSTGAGVACFYKLSGWSGAPVAIVSKDEQGSASSFNSGTLTPSGAGVRALLLGFFSCKVGEFTPASYIPGTDIIEDMDLAAGIGADYEYYAPRSFAGHRVIESTSGTYSLSATNTQSGEWCGMAVLFEE